MGVEVETEGGGGNNLQMKNNPFRSNAISRRADGQTELQSCQSAPSLLKQRLRREWRGMERSLQREGQRMGKKPGYKDDGRRRRFGGDFLQRYSWSGSQ